MASSNFEPHEAARRWDTVAVGSNEFVGYFWIVANDELGIDGVSETDGLEVTSAALGTRFPDGLLVAQDGRNITPSERQNFKYVSWKDVMEALAR